MTQKQYEELKEVIIKANPDIIKLEFGCRLIDSAKNQYYIGCEGRLFEVLGDGMECGSELIDSLENIGRMITLTDVLIALAKKGIFLQYWQDAGGYTFNFKNKFDNTEQVGCSWNLKNNSLDWHWKNQKETVNFLFNLLV